MIVNARWAGVPAWDLAGLPHTAGKAWWLGWTDRVRRALMAAEHELEVTARRARERQQRGGVRPLNAAR